MVATAPLRERVYQWLRDDILSGRLSPREQISEAKLARRYLVSRTPVREAAARLLSEGLLERTDDGFAVTVLSSDETNDLHELRLTLELRGILRHLDGARPAFDAALVEEELGHWRGLREAPPPPGPSFVLQDERFHENLLLASGNPQLTAALVPVNQRLRAVRMDDFLDRAHIAAVIDEHIEILELLRVPDLRGALTALRRHIRG
ncbi:GntR family transcriptional regulator [Kineosporia sp. J2-2]|uniref:GntR family transcriptional regulator n=1 Tax=Kineosporia corallincola TaxID=2835133 RepID=A0ABS5TD68_9ACTN|nr:GntR family transcriptional regulator [Kineosporia corallincola]MBT0768788.1 GntR family transcriptional regulator [Kineosporia corallincola]